jgi:adenosylcobinamide kinase/adenosylcobinamide-phosphate guanylyltransferase
MHPYDDEMLERVARHQQMRRDKGFITLEKTTGVADVSIAPQATLLLECLCNLTANELFNGNNNPDAGAARRILADIISLESRCANLIVVTNDVGSGLGISHSASTEMYLEALGQLNCQLAGRFDAVYELVCGIPIALKGQV